jgi:hypothetical protein
VHNRARCRNNTKAHHLRYRRLPPTEAGGMVSTTDEGRRPAQGTRRVDR